MRRTLLTLAALLPLALGACSTKVEAGPAAMKTVEGGFTQIQDLIGKVKDVDTAKALSDKVTELVPGLKNALDTIKGLDAAKLSEAMKTQKGKLMEQLTSMGTAMQAKMTEFAANADVTSHLQKAMETFKQLSGS
jgi:hypothetical protein